MKKNDNNISKIIAPMFIITMQLDLVIGKLLKEKLNMSLADFKILRAIYMLNDCTQLDIALFNHVTEAAVSKRSKSLSEKGLIKKTINPSDKRKSILTLTSKGKTLMGQMQLVVINNMESILGNLPKHKRDSLRGLLGEILEMVIQHSPNKEALAKSKHPVLSQIKKHETNKN